MYIHMHTYMKTHTSEKASASIWWRRTRIWHNHIVAEWMSVHLCTNVDETQSHFIFFKTHLFVRPEEPTSALCAQLGSAFDSSGVASELHFCPRIRFPNIMRKWKRRTVKAQQERVQHGDREIGQGTNANVMDRGSHRRIHKQDTRFLQVTKQNPTEQHNTTQHNTTQHKTTQRKTSRHNNSKTHETTGRNATKQNTHFFFCSRTSQGYIKSVAFMKRGARRWKLLYYFCMKPPSVLSPQSVLSTSI